MDCTNQNRESTACQKCINNGGKLVPHSFGHTCEIKAKDANKKCKYDYQCSKFNCVYENKDAKRGRCDDYITDNDGVMQCHRRFRKPVTCETTLS